MTDQRPDDFREDLETGTLAGLIGLGDALVGGDATFAGVVYQQRRQGRSPQRSALRWKQQPESLLKAGDAEDFKAARRGGAVRILLDGVCSVEESIGRGQCRRRVGPAVPRWRGHGR